MTRLFGWEFQISPWLLLPGIIAGTLILGLIFRFLLVLLAPRDTPEAKGHPARTLANSVPVLFPLLGLFVVMQGLPLDSGPAGLIRKLLIVTMLLFGAFFVARTLSASVRYWGMKKGVVRSIDAPARFVINIGMAIVVALVILDTLEISITPLLTTLGIGGLAVALAMKDSLSNLIAGIYIAADQPVREGDYVSFDKGKEGTIDKIGWRSTRINTLTNDVIIVPNNRLAQAVVTNYDYPSPTTLFKIPVSVAYGSDTKKVVDVLKDVVVKAAGDMPQIPGEKEPKVRFNPGFGESSLDFEVVFYLRKYADRFDVRDQLRHRFYERLQAEGITIPFPQRDVHLKSGQADLR